jgi:hypothetical protein
LGLSAYTAATAASAAEGQLAAMDAGGCPTNSLTVAASSFWCNSGDTGSDGPLLLLLLLLAADPLVMVSKGMGRGTRWGAAWRRVIRVCRATQASCSCTSTQCSRQLLIHQTSSVQGPVGTNGAAANAAEQAQEGA